MEDNESASLANKTAICMCKKQILTYLQNFIGNMAKIKMPPKLRKRGRPKGAEKTIIGLPKKRRRIGPVPFIKKIPLEKEKSKE